VRLRLTDERVLLRFLDRLNGQVDVEIWPIKMMGTGELHVRDLPNGRILKPRKVPERHEQLPVSHEEPETVW
jgi:hypothetical protein